MQIKKVVLPIAILVFTGLVCFADEVKHAAAVTVDSIDTAAKTVTVKTADGTKDTFKYTSDETVKGVSKGGSFVVHYTGEGADKTATGFDDVGKSGWKGVKGTVVSVDHASKTVVVKAADGTEWTFHASEKCMVETGKGAGEFGSETGKGIAKGSAVTVHFTEEGGKKLVHLFKF